MDIDKTRIRQIYYASSISISILIIILLSSIHLRTYRIEMGRQIREIENSAIELKKNHLLNVINIVIQNIEIEKNESIRDIEISLDEFSGYFEKEIKKSLDQQSLLEEMNSYYIPFGIELKLVESGSNTVLFNSNYEEENDIESKYIKIREIEVDNFKVYIKVSNKFIDEKVQKFTLERIRQLSFEENEYVWVNYIVNYDGGDQYAIRLVHQNLPETEGMYLSTNTVDIQGERPYLIELEGIKKDGELYYEYYFKEVNSEVVSHKLSYAKLYEPYDWVIATGIYLDNLDEYLTMEKDKLQHGYNQLIYRTIIASIAFLLGAILLFALFEKKLQQVLEEYRVRLKEKNAEILKEKKIIEEFAFIDYLTGVANRRAIEERISKAISYSNRYNTTFTIALGVVILLARKSSGTRAGSEYLEYMSTEIQHLPEEIKTMKLDFYKKFQEEDFGLTNDTKLFDWATKQLYIPFSNMMTAVAGIGIDSCPMEGFDLVKNSQLKKLLSG